MNEEKIKKQRIPHPQQPPELSALAEKLEEMVGEAEKAALQVVEKIADIHNFVLLSTRSQEFALLSALQVAIHTATTILSATNKTVAGILTAKAQLEAQALQRHAS